MVKFKIEEDKAPIKSDEEFNDSDLENLQNFTYIQNAHLEVDELQKI